MDTSNNPFSSDSVPFQKPGLLLDLGAGGDVFKQNGTSPSANDLYFLDRPANGKGNFDDDDFGPETDVDAVDDVLLSPSKVANSPRNNNPFEEKLFEDDEMEKKAFEQLIANVGQEKNEFDPMKDTRQETPTPPAGEGNLFEDKPLEEKAETDLDAVDDVLLSPSKDASSLRNNNPFEEKLLEDDELEKRAVEQLIANVKQGKDESEPVVEESKEETSKPSADEVACFTNLVLEPDNVAESGEESEDEWNYYRVEPTAETADTNQQSTEQICEKSAQQLEEEENMESQLNPNAKEFVPSPTQLIPPAQDILIAESPKNGTTVENISLPTHLEFQHEVSQRPSELDLTDEPKQKVAGKLPDLISSEEGGDAKTFPPPGAICGKSIEHLENGMFKDFLDQGDRNFQELQSSNLQSSLGLGLDESEVSSTKAEFGDDSNMSFMTSELQKTFSENVSCVAGVEKSFSEHELLGSEFTSDIISSDGSEPPEFNGSEIYKKLGTVEVSSSNVTVVERDPLSLSFEIEKQLVPEMESKPERVQLESEGTSSFEQDDSGSPIRTVAMGEVSDVKVFTDLEAPVEEEQVPYKVDLSDEVSNIKQSELSLPDIDNAPSSPKPSEDEQPSSSPVSPKLSAPHLEDGALEPKSSISEDAFSPIQAEDAFSPIQETSPKPSQSPPLSPVLSNKSLQSPLLSKPELSPLHSQDLLQEFEASPKSPLLAQEPHSPPKSPLLETSVPVEQQIVLAQEPHSPPKSPLLETSMPVEQQIESPQSPLLSKSPVWEASSPLPSAADTALSTPETVPVGKDGTPSPLLETKSPVDFSVLVETDLQTLQEKGIEKEEHFSSVTPDKEQPSQVSTSELDIMDVRYPTDSLAADFSLEENQIQPSDFSVKPIEDDSVTQVPPPTPAHLSEDLLNADIETLEEKLDLSTEKADAVSEKMDLEKEKTEEKKEEIPVVGAAVVGGTVAAVAAAVGVVKATDEKFADKKPAATEAKKSPTPKDKKGPIPDKTKATKTTTPKAAVPTTAKLSQKSTPTSPTKPLTTTARTSTPKKPLTPTTTSLTSKATKSPAASTAKSKPTPPLTSKTTPSTTKTSTTKPVTASPRPKPPSTTTASKSAVLTNGDASKPAAIRKPGTITAAKPPSRPATAPATTKTTTKQVTSVTSRTTTTPRPKPGAVNGTTTKPRTTGTVAPATARSKVTMARDTKQVTDKQVKETANKQISSSRSLTATKSATTTTAKRVSGVTKTSMSVTNTAKSATTKTAVKKTMATATSKTTTKTQVTVTATTTENNELVQVQPVVD